MVTFSVEEQKIINAKPQIYNQEDPELAVQALLRDLGHPDHTHNTGPNYQELFTLLVRVAIARTEERFA